MFDRQEALERGRQLLERSKICSRCGRGLRAGEPVWRKRGRFPICKRCIRSFLEHFPYVRASGPCDTCGRTVHFLQGREWRRHFFCSEGCGLLHQHAKARQRRAEARGPTRGCATCGEHFELTRADSRFCSGACRQKAYRKRVTAGEHAVIGAFAKRNGVKRKRVTDSKHHHSETFDIRNGDGVTDSKPLVTKRIESRNAVGKPVTP